MAAVVHALVGVGVLCSSIAFMLREVDKTTCSSPYERDRMLNERDRLETDYQGGGQKGKAAGRKAFEIRDYLTKLSPEIATQLPERKSSSKKR